MNKILDTSEKFFAFLAFNENDVPPINGDTNVFDF